MSGFLVFSIVLVSLIYTYILMQIRRDWKQPQLPTGGNGNVTVLVALRNEERNLDKLFRSFEAITYPKTQFEVILIDDHSDDQSNAMCTSFAERTSIKVKLIRLDGKLSGKRMHWKPGLRVLHTKTFWLQTRIVRCHQNGLKL